MIFRAPAKTQSLSTLIDQLVTRDNQVIARHLGISTRTLARWRAEDKAPRMAQLALFWETNYGLAVADCHAVNGERYARGLANSLEAECDNLRARIRYLEKHGDFGAANMPHFVKAYR